MFVIFLRKIMGKQSSKKNELLQSAYQCFATKGYKATRTAEIPDRLGMSSGNLFHYFKSKEEILFTLIIEEGKQTADEMNQLLVQKNPIVALQAFIEKVGELASDSYYVGFALEISSLAHQDAEVARLVQENDLILRGGLTKLIQKIQQSNKQPNSLSSEQIATWIVILIEGVFARLAVDPDFQIKKEIIVAQKLIATLLQS